MYGRSRTEELQAILPWVPKETIVVALLKRNGRIYSYRFLFMYGRSWTEESLQKIETFSPDNASNVVERDKLVYRTRIETGS